MLEQMIGSIKNYFYNKWSVTILSKKVPTEVTVPSMYFPQASVIPSLHSKDSFENTYLMSVSLFHTTTEEAISKASLIAESIKKDKFSIPIVNADGTLTSDVIIFERVDIEEIDVGTVQIALQWNKSFNYN